ncbi:uncharacterized protein BXZ73DRAFT_48308 [Epithele typhae]|uniref:uncharacterized protein n=1 Tax=Epithele typhae TaxID=378194 RepID=UPI0020078A38|nr:uncharacterized protein BXZ73DRAFT_48308 [Epithele typhae]KAH9929010.1 hypothetical protein BXZ73DRAFT_48308 [Epithele typhae]
MARRSPPAPGSGNASRARPSPTPRTHALSPPASRRQSLYAIGEGPAIQLHWLFRSNIPRRRGMSMPLDARKRNFFGVGEIISVLANPSETLRSLTESKRMLEETRRELEEARERAQLTPTHTFSPLPGFFDRPAELKAITRALEGEPSFTVLFGASSVGKTALLRQVLTQPNYHVLHFDLRIAGFADLASLYMSLSQQMEGFFMAIAQDSDMPGYEPFEKEAWSFKHDRLNVERRVSNAGQSTDALGSPVGDIKTSDIARLMELFQSSLLRYWNFQPSPEALQAKRREEHEDGPNKAKGRQEKPSWPHRMFSMRRKQAEKAARENGDATQTQEKKPEAPMKKIPVFFIDEAHKLPALIRSIDAMKCLLDAMLVLTKQDRLCHVIHATSDPFYQTWLRQLNIMQHCKIITIGDYPKAETRKYFRERILPGVPEQLRRGLEFEKLYEAFGGKFAHWQDYVTDYVNSNGRIDIQQSSHFIQAHALLNLHVIHSSQASPNGQAAGESPGAQNNEDASTHAIHRLSPPMPMNTGTGPSGQGFRIYSPLQTPHQSPSTFLGVPSGSGIMGGGGGHSGASASNGEEAPVFQADFSALQLLRVMNRLAQPRTRALPYFLLCREMGARAIDGMVKGRILDLRWTEPVSRDTATTMGGAGRAPRESVRLQLGQRAAAGATAMERERQDPGSSGTAVDELEGAGAGAGPSGASVGPSSAVGAGAATGAGAGAGATGMRPETVWSDAEMEPMSDEEIIRAHERLAGLAPPYPASGEEEEEVLGPKLVPISPIMRFAMVEVVQEYYADEDRTESEYASLSDVDVEEY